MHSILQLEVSRTYVFAECWVHFDNAATDVKTFIAGQIGRKFEATDVAQTKL